MADWETIVKRVMGTVEPGASTTTTTTTTASATGATARAAITSTPWYQLNPENSTFTATVTYHVRLISRLYTSPGDSSNPYTAYNQGSEKVTIGLNPAVSNAFNAFQRYADAANTQAWDGMWGNDPIVNVPGMHRAHQHISNWQTTLATWITTAESLRAEGHDGWEGGAAGAYDDVLANIVGAFGQIQENFQGAAGGETVARLIEHAADELYWFLNGYRGAFGNWNNGGASNPATVMRNALVLDDNDNKELGKLTTEAAVLTWMQNHPRFGQAALVTLWRNSVRPFDDDVTQREANLTAVYEPNSGLIRPFSTPTMDPVGVPPDGVDDPLATDATADTPDTSATDKKLDNLLNGLSDNGATGDGGVDLSGSGAGNGGVDLSGSGAGGIDLSGSGAGSGGVDLTGSGSGTITPGGSVDLPTYSGTGSGLGGISLGTTASGSGMGTLATPGYLGALGGVGGVGSGSAAATRYNSVSSLSGAGANGLNGAAAEAGATRLAGEAGGSGVPIYPPTAGGMGGGMGAGGEAKERERHTWLAEDRDVWGLDPDAAPAVVGRPTPGASTERDEFDDFEVDLGRAGHRVVDGRRTQR